MSTANFYQRNTATSIKGGRKSEKKASVVMQDRKYPIGTESTEERVQISKKKGSEEGIVVVEFAEFCEGSVTGKSSALPAQEKEFQVQAEVLGVTNTVGEIQRDGEGEKGESAAARKKRKKKEKNAAAAASLEVKEELKEAIAGTIELQKSITKGKVVEKKVPQRLRYIQEAIARRREYAEKKAREEEEKRRKEEEEMRRLEELERQEEEARRWKKERKREKFLKKKQEGKLLTAKQKEEIKRLESTRNQIFSNPGVAIPTINNEDGPSKRPMYQTKKVKPAIKAEESIEVKEKEHGKQELMHELDSQELKESTNVGEKSEVSMPDETEDNGDDEQEWDAKSWHGLDLNINGAFDDGKVDCEPEHVVKKEVKVSMPVSQSNAGRAILQPMKPHNAENNKFQTDITDAREYKRNGVGGKNRGSVPDTTTNQGKESLRSLICCIMGHVDSGKTKLLDCIRGTKVQEQEAGGITQQIGATYITAENIREKFKALEADAKLRVPGLLIMDTPGHESFSNLRSRGSGLCDIVILVVDIMHGLEQQTIESLNLLKIRNTEFIIALNKVDRLYGWKTCPGAPIIKAIKQQSKDVRNEFHMRLTEVVTQFKEQGLNAELYYKNKEMGEIVSIVPTSAISGEGIPDLLLLLARTQKTMVEKLTFRNEVQCSVLEVNVTEGHGTTIDVVLVNGVLHEGDQIVVCGFQGPIVTRIRALLTPHPVKGLRVKGTYEHHKKIKAAQYIKISAQGLAQAIGGTGLYVGRLDEDLEDAKKAAMDDMKSVMGHVDKGGIGVYVQASTLGSLEALLEFLKSPTVNIPVGNIGLGPLYKKDVMKASLMLEKKEEYASILAFDDKVAPEAQEHAKELGIKIFSADVIYQLFKEFKDHIDKLKEGKKEEAVFPCILQILEVFRKKDPLILGVKVLQGMAKVGTPICVLQDDVIHIGPIESIQKNRNPVDQAKAGQTVGIKIGGSNHGRHFEVDDELVSHITRKSNDALEAYFLDDLSPDDLELTYKLEKLLRRK